MSEGTAKGPQVTRCTVKAVEDRMINGRFQNVELIARSSFVELMYFSDISQILDVTAVATKEPCQIILRDDWAHADVCPGRVHTFYDEGGL